MSQALSWPKSETIREYSGTVGWDEKRCVQRRHDRAMVMDIVHWVHCLVTCVIHWCFTNFCFNDAEQNEQLYSTRADVGWVIDTLTHSLTRARREKYSTDSDDDIYEQHGCGPPHVQRDRARQHILRLHLQHHDTSTPQAFDVPHTRMPHQRGERYRR